MSLMTMTAESIGTQLGVVVPDLYVVVAKNDIVGMDQVALADLLGVTTQELQEMQADPIYRDVRLLLACEYAKTQIESDFNWDGIESQALSNLAKRVKYEQDTETLLRIAAVANKAQRRTAVSQNRVLDPAAGGARVPLTLTSRMVKRINARTGDTEVEETRQISITDGTAQNPTFEDIDSLLGVSRRPPLSRNMRVISTETFSVDDLEFKG